MLLSVFYVFNRFYYYIIQLFPTVLFDNKLKLKNGPVPATARFKWFLSQLGLIIENLCITILSKHSVFFPTKKMNFII